MLVDVHSVCCTWWLQPIRSAGLARREVPATHLMTSSNGNIFRVTGPLWGEFTGHRWIPLTRPVTWSFDIFFDLRLNKRLSKQPRRLWFETPSHSLWRHSYGVAKSWWHFWPGLRSHKLRLFLAQRYLKFFFNLSLLKMMVGCLAMALAPNP